MKIIRKIALSELQTLFYSPIAWLILIVFTFQSAMAFMDTFGTFVRNQELNYSIGNLTLSIFGKGLFSKVQEYLYLYIPLLTMSLISRELSSGSIKLLYSSPVKNSQIILGKYLSMMIYGLVLMAILSVFIVLGAFTIKDFDFPVILSAMLGLYLLVCTYAAIGLFMSSLTSYQIVAAVCTLTVIAVLNTVARFGQEYDVIREITWWFSIVGRGNQFIAGLICSEDILYFLIVTVLFLSLSILRMKAIRQKMRWQLAFSKYIVVFLLAVALGYISSRPKLMFFYDTTRTKLNTLTENSQEIIKLAEGGLTLTTYVNALDGMLSLGLPRNRKNDVEHFSQYIRFKPEIKTKYVYYYQNPGDPMLERRYPGMSDSRILGQISKAMNIDSTMFKAPEEMPNIAELEAEGYILVRELERDNGQKTYLRMFYDMLRYPGESEISAALKRLVMDLPLIGFAHGRGERDYNNEGDRGYYTFSQAKTFRNSLINQGFDCRAVRLNKEISPEINILVIADVRTNYSETERANLDAYIKRGGNLLILGDVRRQETMNPLIAQFGVRFMPGQLVKYVREKPKPVAVNAPKGAKNASASLMGNPASQAANKFTADFIQSYFTKEGSALSYIFESIHRREAVVTMPGALGLEYTIDQDSITPNGFRLIPLLVSESQDSWNELETTNFIDDTVRLNPAIGEEIRSYPTAVALTRSLGGREQKIIIMGDADCLSNAELAMRRSKVRASNYNMIMGTFFWMSDNEVPIDTRRPSPPDNKLNFSGDNVRTTKWLFVGGLPLLLLVASLFIWLRRRGR